MTSIHKVKEQKLKLEQKKNRLFAEEIKLKMKERKMRTRHLIEVGGLAAKAGIDFLPTNTLYGAFVSLLNSLEQNPKIKDSWTKIGKDLLDKEEQSITPIILKFEQMESKEIRDSIRSHGLKWNKFRAEWYGNVENLDLLRKDLTELGNPKYDIELIK